MFDKIRNKYSFFNSICIFLNFVFFNKIFILLKNTITLFVSNFLKFLLFISKFLTGMGFLLLIYIVLNWNNIVIVNREFTDKYNFYIFFYLMMFFSIFLIIYRKMKNQSIIYPLISFLVGGLVVSYLFSFGNYIFLKVFTFIVINRSLIDFIFFCFILYFLFIFCFLLYFIYDKQIIYLIDNIRIKNYKYSAVLNNTSYNYKLFREYYNKNYKKINFYGTAVYKYKSYCGFKVCDYDLHIDMIVLYELDKSKYRKMIYNLELPLSVNLFKQLKLSDVSDEYGFIYITYDQFRENLTSYSYDNMFDIEGELIDIFITLIKTDIYFIYIYNSGLINYNDFGHLDIKEIVICVKKSNINKIMLSYEKKIKELDLAVDVSIIYLNNIDNFFNRSMFFKKYLKYNFGNNCRMSHVSNHFFVFQLDLYLLEYYLLGNYFQRIKTLAYGLYDDFFLVSCGIYFCENSYNIFINDVEMKKLFNDLNNSFIDVVTKNYILLPTIRMDMSRFKFLIKEI